MTLDAEFSDHGSMWLVHLYSEAAQDWVASNVADDAQWFGATLAVEPRYVPALAEGMADAGLAVGRV
jgi:hypothetical protein